MKLWFNVPGLKGLYEINRRTHRVRSIKRNKLIGTFYSVGYKRVSMSKNGQPKTMLIHRILAILFIPNPENKPCVNHLDGVKTNNNLSNLEWCTYKENNNHAMQMGLNPLKGEANGRAKITMKIAQSIRKEYTPFKMTRKKLAEKYSISKPMVDKILSNSNWI